MTLAIIGSYANPDQPGLYVCKFDTESGQLEVVDQASGLHNPTFLDIDKESSMLYTLIEQADPSGQRCGGVAAYRVDVSSGKLTLLNKETVIKAPICHVTLDRTRQSVMVASYHGGMIGLSPVLEDGRVGTTADTHTHQGSGLLPVQHQARAHSVTVDRGNQFAVVCDLGMDALVVYKLDISALRLIPHDQVSVAPGSGPRHFAFHPSLPYGYVIHELNATITAFAYEQEEGRLSEIQIVSTLPDGYEGENACADIHISPDGRFLYGSNRGHDSIAVYAIDQTNGHLAWVEYASVLGAHPRGFGLSPDGRFVLAANRDTNQIVVFARNESLGTLHPVGQTLEVSTPVCIKFI